MKIYIIHGWSYSLDLWENAKSEFTKLGIEPVFLKVPGLTEPSDKVWDIDGYIEWLRDSLKGNDKPVVIGHSNGGRIASAYLNKYPNSLSKLILIDSAGVAHNEFVPSLKLKILKVLSKIGKVFSYIPPIKKLFYKVIGAQDYMNAPQNMKLTMRNMLAADKDINFASITIPTIIIWGREDKITPLSDGQKIHSEINNSKFFIIEDARHAPFNNHAPEVTKIIADEVSAQ